jgi:hypothetical protein
MNSVDVGWISTGANEEKRARLFVRLIIPPLDSVDGAMRIIHPIIETESGNTDLYGKLLKNYSVVNWLNSHDFSGLKKGVEWKLVLLAAPW